MAKDSKFGDPWFDELNRLLKLYKHHEICHDCAKYLKQIISLLTNYNKNTTKQQYFIISLYNLRQVREAISCLEVPIRISISNSAFQKCW